MHGLLSKLFQKRGIESFQDLTNEEQETFKGWDAILSKEELTLEDVKVFCKTQLNIIEGKWKDYSISQDKKAEFIPYHVVYSTLLQVIDSPKDARHQLEEYLTKLLTS